MFGLADICFITVSYGMLMCTLGQHQVYVDLVHNEVNILYIISLRLVSVATNHSLR